eukprot:TRINITY_DN2676_c0_g1_i1.p1 TRINITY_DN2676_c0_g1~~TRINITY_DN2676_c0_g1_i1.p1  ORF type:complete len:188 (+),score=40.95 TRINITY_DN2676_c0_g1_i1:50-613(+)
MAGLTVARGLSNSTNQILMVRALSTSAARLGGVDKLNQPVPWNYLWKPGPVPPTTDSERVAAAKKYGLIVEDYKPIVDREGAAGDYPDLPLVPEAYRSGLYEWDDPHFRRDYGEPLHIDWYIYREIRYTPHRGRMTMAQMWKYFLTLIGSILGAWYIFEYYVPHYQRYHIAMQTYKDGPAYTFEPLD